MYTGDEPGTKQKETMPKPKEDGKEPKNTPPEPKKPGDEGYVFEPAKLSDEDLAKALEDPRIWKTDRLAELREAQKKLKTLEEEKEKAEKAELEKKGEFETLQKKTQAELDKANENIANMKKMQAITTAAVAKGIQDVDAASKLIDMSGVKIGEDGSYTGVDEAIEGLVKARPYLVNPQSIGNPSNPGNPTGGDSKTYTMSQIGDAKFYQENREDIQKAQAEGRIVEDRNMMSNTPGATPPTGQ